MLDIMVQQQLLLIVAMLDIMLIIMLNGRKDLVFNITRSTFKTNRVPMPDLWW
jgi:hypothetical protein